jgi:hypothetical protein
MGKQGAEKECQRGVYASLAAVSMLTLVGVVGLGLDTARLVLTIRDTQRALDSAALAAAVALQQQDIAGWQNSKKAALGAFRLRGGVGLDAIARDSFVSRTFRFAEPSGFQTPSDLPDYERSTGVAGNVSLSLGRGLVCYRRRGAGWQRFWYSLEKITNSTDGSTDRYCHANSIKIAATLRDLSPIFMRVLGFTQFSTVKLSSSSFVTFSSVCGEPLCDTLGVEEGTGDIFGQHFKPTAPCVVNPT